MDGCLDRLQMGCGDRKPEGAWPRNHIRCAFQTSFLLETELRGSLEVGPGCWWVCSPPLCPVFHTHLLRTEAVGSHPGTEQKVGGERRVEVWPSGWGKVWGTQVSLGFDSVPVSFFRPSALQLRLPASVTQALPRVLITQPCSPPSVVRLVPPRAHGGDLRPGGGPARRQAEEGWKAGPGQREGPRAGSRGNRSPGASPRPGVGTAASGRSVSQRPSARGRQALRTHARGGRKHPGACPLGVVPGARTGQAWRRCRQPLAPRAWRAAPHTLPCSSRSPMPAPTALGSHALQCSTPGPGPAPTPSLGTAPGTGVTDPLLLQRGGHSSTPPEQMCEVGGLLPAPFFAT